jgi:hypothetical protein
VVAVAVAAVAAQHSLENLVALAAAARYQLRVGHQRRTFMPLGLAMEIQGLLARQQLAVAAQAQAQLEIAMAWVVQELQFQSREPRHFMQAAELDGELTQRQGDLAVVEMHL